MPKSPEELSDLIRQFAQEAARRRAKSLSNEAEDRIASIPAEYRNLPVIEVDQERLRFMIEDIIDFAAQYSSEVIGSDAVSRALSEVKCHYLWFC